MRNPSSDNALIGTDTASAETLTTVVDSLNTTNMKRVHIAIGISGGSVIAFDQFVLSGRIKRGTGSWLSLQSAWGTTEEDAFLLKSPGALESLAHDASSYAVVDIWGFEEIRVQSAQAGVTASAVTRTLAITKMA